MSSQLQIGYRVMKQKRELAESILYTLADMVVDNKLGDIRQVLIEAGYLRGEEE